VSINVSTDNYKTESDDTAVVITVSGVDDAIHVLKHVIWSYSAAPNGGNLEIKKASDVVFSTAITAAGQGSLLDLDLEFGVNQDLVVTLAAGSGTVVGKLNVYSVQKRAV